MHHVICTHRQVHACTIILSALHKISRILNRTTCAPYPDHMHATECTGAKFACADSHNTHQVQSNKDSQDTGATAMFRQHLPAIC